MPNDPIEFDSENNIVVIRDAKTNEIKHILGRNDVLIDEKNERVYVFDS